MVVVLVTSEARERWITFRRRIAIRAIVLHLRHAVACGNDNSDAHQYVFKVVFLNKEALLGLL